MKSKFERNILGTMTEVDFDPQKNILANTKKSSNESHAQIQEHAHNHTLDHDNDIHKIAILSTN